MGSNTDSCDRRVGLIYDDRMCKHTTPDDEDHPEKPDRIRVIWNRLQSSGIAKRCVILDAKEAEDKHIALVHTKFHIDLIKSISSAKLDSRRNSIAAQFNSIYFNQGSSESAYLAAGSVIEAAEKVANGELDSAFAIVRPPGHHAEKNEPMGFCLYNNVAIATSYLLNERKDLGINKVLIVDWDVHHGNGTQSTFWKDPRVLFFSVHRYESGSFYPAGGDGSHLMTGEGLGAGYNINVPWENGRCGDADYLAVWDHILTPVAKKFCPDMVFVSAGFDAAVGDPLGGCRVSPYGYSVMLSKLMEFAGGKIVLALEGGYNLDSIAKSAQACVEVLLQQKPIPGSSEAYPFESTWKVIQNVREELSAFWPTLSEKLADKVTSERAPYVHIISSDSEDEDSGTHTVAEDLDKVIDNVIVPLSSLKVNEDAADQAIAVSSTWRSELQKIGIWYATFGSNMYFPRLRCYIEGGKVEGMQNQCAGAMDKSLPKEIIWKTIPHRLFFGRDHTVTWGHGGVAFLHPESTQDKAYTCLYRITLDQFNDILLQENDPNYDMRAPLFDLIALHSIENEKTISVEAVKRGWYHNVLYLGKEGGIPILTMTCTSSDVDSFKSGKFPIRAPPKAYADVLIKGLVEGKQLSEEQASAYIQDAYTRPL
ncbi:histone deacetylase 5 [Ipomoea triloba]|uniref:histone deacetylase 5 n=1 Tax=Ipomoea triloba TaxID=35885 RepID=UPI00125E225D|nr:histone deacetylase 5 [Ipomoea triloba]